MPIDANEEAGDLVRLTVRDRLTAADQATAEAPARTWLSA